MALALFQITDAPPRRRLIEALEKLDSGDLVYIWVQPTHTSVKPFKLLARVTALDNDGPDRHLQKLTLRTWMDEDRLAGECDLRTRSEGYLNCDNPLVAWLGLDRDLAQAMGVASYHRFSDFSCLDLPTICERLAGGWRDELDKARPPAEMERGVDRGLRLRNRLDALGYSLQGERLTDQQIRETFL